MKWTRARVCADVRQMLNRDTRTQSLVAVGDLDTLALDRIIAAAMPGAAMAVELEAPATMLESGYNFAGDSDLMPGRASADKRLTVLEALLPADFMRLVSFRLSDWPIALTEPVASGSQLHAMLQMPGASALVAAGSPVAVIERRPQGLTLATWSRSDPVEATVSEAVYRPLPEWDRDDAIEISRQLYGSAVEACAAAVALTLQR